MNNPPAARAHPVDILDFLARHDAEIPPLKIVDVGAMDVGEAEPWARMVASGRASLVGFEPNEDEYRKLNAAGRSNT